MRFAAPLLSSFPQERAGALHIPSCRRGACELRLEAVRTTPAMAAGRMEAAASRVAVLEEELRCLAEELSRCQVSERGARR